MKSGLPFPFLGHRWWFIGFLALIWSSILHAQVTVDGTLGPAGPLSGPHYAISADLGRQIGGNLFHSFGQFSIHAGESATFSGPNAVANIIGRVTGGQTSLIDGTMRSTIPGASLYLLNPAGILFGENARLDVQGSFHASTADYLRLSDGGRFDARAPGDGLLTVAPVAAFGFLGGAPAPITIDGSFLTVPAGQTLSLIGGDITLTDATVYAPGGRIDVAAVGSAGEVAPTATDLALQGFGAMGTLTMTREPTAAWLDGVGRVMVDRGEPLGEMPLADLDTSGDGGGAIFIRGGRWASRSGWVVADTHGARAGRDIQVTITRDIRFDQGARLTADTTSAGAGGTINLIADTLTLNRAYIYSTTSGSGDAGSITLDVDQLSLRGGSWIDTSTWGAGDGGDLTITARDSVSIEGSGLSASAGRTGRAGAIRVIAPALDLTDWAGIYSTTSGSGDAGSITLEVDQLSLRQSQIESISLWDSSGDAGSITLEVDQLSLREDSWISTETRGAGDGGDLTVTARHSVSIAGTAGGNRSGLFTSSSLAEPTGREPTGRAGTIRVTAPVLDLTERAYIYSSTSGSGDAGSITLDVDQLGTARKLMLQKIEVW